MSIEMGPEPTIGRIVHYKAPANDEFPSRTLAGLITGVHENREVDGSDFHSGRLKLAERLMVVDGGDTRLTV